MRVYRNTAYFIDEVYNLVCNEYTVLSEFEKMKANVIMKHNICGKEWPVTPDAFLRKKGTRCPKCFGNSRKTTEQFCDEIFKLHGLDYSVVGEYVSAKVNIKMRHNVCRHIYPVRPNNILQGDECPECYGTPLKTHEQFVSEVTELLGDEYKVINRYIRNDKRVTFYHTVCKNTYPVIPRNIISKQTKCPFCKSKELGNLFRKKHEKFVSEVYLKYEEEYTVIGKYKGAHTDILIRHEKCKREYPVKPTDFLSGKQCSRCQRVERITTEDFKRLVRGSVGDEYIVVGEYVNARKPITILHSICEQEFNPNPYEFVRRDTRCPCITASKGNRRIASYLKTKTCLTYMMEYRDRRCRDERPLPFDSAIFYEDVLLFLVEFDGKQHEEPVEHFGGVEQFALTQKHDRIKNDFCNYYTIPIIRIKRKEFDKIESVLNKALIKHCPLEAKIVD